METNSTTAEIDYHVHHQIQAMQMAHKDPQPTTQAIGQMSMTAQDRADATKSIQGLQAPETSMLPPIQEKQKSSTSQPNEAGNATMNERSSQGEGNKKEVLDHMVRLEFDIDPAKTTNDNANIFSFYTNYVDYLDDYNLIEVSIVFRSFQDD
jgi:hypothetical protein